MPWIENYFSSIARQTYQNWSLIYIDDASNDGTYEKMTELRGTFHRPDAIDIRKNDYRKGHLSNQYYAIHGCPKDAVIIIVDGDDQLAHDQVFETINQTYQDEDIWITYGQFFYVKKNKKGFCRPIPADVIEKNGLRDISWRTSHLRTFYAGLYQRIQLEDLHYNGTFFPKCADVATMFPMLEMAGFHHKFIQDILYLYNDDNPLSYHHDPTHQRELEAHIRKMPRYQPLKEKPW